MKTNQIILALVGVALGFTATTLYLKNKTKKPCGCGCGGDKNSEATKMANASGRLAQSSLTLGEEAPVKGRCRVCEGSFGIGYYAIDGKCKAGDACRESF